MCRLFRGSALAAAVFAWVVPLAAPAAIDQASAHFIAPNWSFKMCRDRIQAALRAEKFAIFEVPANSGDFRGYSNVREDASGSLDTTNINCWPTSGGMRITFGCASQTPDNRAQEICFRLIARVFANHPPKG